MFDVLTQAAILIACGALWRRYNPIKIDPSKVRLLLTNTVYYFLLPALVLVVLWRADLGIESLKLSAAALVGLVFSLAIAMFWYRLNDTPKATTGALLLAATFPNVTYLGLPVLEATFGSWARSIALQYDLFACTPFLFTVGILVARHYGNKSYAANPIIALMKVPPIWAAIAGVSLNLNDVAVPATMAQILEILAAGVVPLMLLSIGLGLVWPENATRYTMLLVPVFVIQFVLGPLLVWSSAYWVGLEGDFLTAVVLEAAMPSMLFGIVLCDRYGLDSQLYASAATLTTLAAVIVLPIWHSVLTI